jgi:hypothetical protein
MVPSKYLFLWLALFSAFQPVHSLVLHIFNDTYPETPANISLTSYYTTLGIAPSQPFIANISFLSSNNFSSDCRFSLSTDVSSLKDKFVVLESFPEWFSYASFSLSTVPTVAKVGVFQMHGTRFRFLARTTDILTGFEFRE